MAPGTTIQVHNEFGKVEPAIVTTVHNESCINCFVFSEAKGVYLATSVLRGDLHGQWQPIPKSSGDPPEEGYDH